jgi:hypothetical protein
MIYEGTNEIQAIDLLVRKVLPDAGAGLVALLLALCESLDPRVPAQVQFGAQVVALRDLTAALIEAAKSDQELPYWVADDYLRAVALTLLAWAWLEISHTPQPQIPNNNPSRWTEPAEALRNWVLPEFEMRLQIIKARLKQGT